METPQQGGLEHTGLTDMLTDPPEKYWPQLASFLPHEYLFSEVLWRQVYEDGKDLELAQEFWVGDQWTHMHLYSECTGPKRNVDIFNPL